MSIKFSYDEIHKKRLIEQFMHDVFPERKDIIEFYPINSRDVLFITNRGSKFIYSSTSRKRSLIRGCPPNYDYYDESDYISKMDHFGTRLAKAIDESEWNHDEVMWRSGLPVGRFKKYLNGLAYPDDSDIYDLASAIECDISDIE